MAVASFAVNYLTEQGIGIDQSRASQLFSFCQITFTIGRFVVDQSFHTYAGLIV